MKFIAKRNQPFKSNMKFLIIIISCNLSRITSSWIKVYYTRRDKQLFYLDL